MAYLTITILNQKMDKLDKMAKFEKNPIFDFWIHVWKNFEMKFRIYGTQIKEIQPQIKKIKVAWELNSNWTWP